MIIIFNTATDKLLQVCNTEREDVLPEYVAYKVLDAKYLNRADYTIREYPGIYTTNEFKKYMYISGGIVYKKPHQALAYNKTVIIADGIDTITLTNCIVGATLFVNDLNLGEIGLDGIVELTAAVPSTLVIELKKTNCVTQEVRFNAN